MATGLRKFPKGKRWQRREERYAFMCYNISADFRSNRFLEVISRRRQVVICSPTPEHPKFGPRPVSIFWPADKTPRWERRAENCECHSLEIELAGTQSERQLSVPRFGTKKNPGFVPRRNVPRARHGIFPWTPHSTRIRGNSISATESWNVLNLFHCSRYMEHAIH